MGQVEDRYQFIVLHPRITSLLPLFSSDFTCLSIQPLIFSITNFIKSNLVCYSGIVKARAELQLFKRIGVRDKEEQKAEA